VGDGAGVSVIVGLVVGAAVVRVGMPVGGSVGTEELPQAVSKMISSIGINLDFVFVFNNNFLLYFGD
jgi:hypothetical protein